ncbi:MAG: 2-hydroxymuconate tautomerase [Candidatus Altiarchaeota archaeon]
MPVIEVKLWDGRTPEQKEKVIAVVTDAICESIGCPREHVHVIIHDVKKENWGIGGKQASKIQ